MRQRVRLSLEKAYNVRELGGYPSSEENVTSFQQFLRSDDLSNITEKDIRQLVNYGVRAVIDLRSDHELTRAPNPFQNMEGIQFLHAPLLKMDREIAQSIGHIEEMLKTYGGFILAHIYVEILKNGKEMLKTIFEFIAKQEGTVLFNCTAGKDRTGVLAMLLLGLAGVSRADIIANYMVTEVYNDENPNKRVVNLPVEVPEELLTSKPEYIAHAYDYIIKEHGNFEQYLLSTGIDEKMINQLKKKLT